MKKSFLVILTLLSLSACGKNPEQARKDLVEMGLQYDQSVFYQVAYKCDPLPIDDFITGGMEPGIGLVGAADGGCLEIVKKLIDKTKEKEAPPAALSQVLEQKADPNRTEIAKFLLQSGVDPNIKLEGENSFLTDAVKNNYVEIVKLLLDKGANPNDGNENSEALIDAASISTEMTKMLLNKGANPNSVGCSTNYPCTPLSSAVKSDNIETVKILLDNKANVNDGENNTSISLQEAVSKNKVEIVNLLLKSGANPNGKDGNSQILEIASRNFSNERGSIELIRSLLEKGANSNTIVSSWSDYSLLQLAVELNNPELVKLLLQYRAKPNNDEKESPALAEAVSEKNVEIVKLLLNSGANPNTKNGSCYLLNALDNEDNREIANLIKAKGGTKGGGKYCT